MSRRHSDIRLRRMLDHASEAIALTQDKSRSDLDSDRLLGLALVRLLEIVGEAASRVPAEERALYPEIPWPHIVGLRNRLIHGYDAVDYDILYQVLVHDLPELVVVLEDPAARRHGIVRSRRSFTLNLAYRGEGKMRSMSWFRR